MTGTPRTIPRWTKSVIMYGAFGINKNQSKKPSVNIILFGFDFFEKDNRRELIIKGINAKKIFQGINTKDIFPQIAIRKIFSIIANTKRGIIDFGILIL